MIRWLVLTLIGVAVLLIGILLANLLGTWVPEGQRLWLVVESQCIYWGAFTLGHTLWPASEEKE